MRRVLVNTLTDEHRRIWRWRERSMAVLPDVPFQAGRVEAEGAERLRTALRDLPPRMQAAVVFRYFYDLGVTETADALGCSEGTPKGR